MGTCRNRFLPHILTLSLPASLPALLCSACPSLPCLPFPQVQEGSFVKKTLFNWGYSRKLHALQKGFAYNKVRLGLTRRGCLIGWLIERCNWVAVRQGEQQWRLIVAKAVQPAWARCVQRLLKRTARALACKLQANEHAAKGSHSPPHSAFPASC
jgi:hypothetical protein